MTHVRQELTLAPVCQFRGFSCCRVLLNRLSQVEDHLIDLGLERVHLARRLDSDEASEISIRSGRRNLGESTDLRCKICSHSIDGHAINFDWSVNCSLGLY